MTLTLQVCQSLTGLPPTVYEAKLYCWRGVAPQIQGLSVTALSFSSRNNGGGLESRQVGQTCMAPLLKSSVVKTKM